MLSNRKLLVTVTLPTAATFEQALDRLGLSTEEADADYGLVPLREEAGKYALLVTEAAAARLEHEEGSKRPDGVFSNPKIEPFGPPVM